MTFEVAFHGLLGHHKATADLVPNHFLDDAIRGAPRDAETLGDLVDGEQPGRLHRCAAWLIATRSPNTPDSRIRRSVATNMLRSQSIAPASTASARLLCAMS